MKKKIVFAVILASFAAASYGATWDKDPYSGGVVYASEVARFKHNILHGYAMLTERSGMSLADYKAALEKEKEDASKFQKNLKSPNTYGRTPLHYIGFVTPKVSMPEADAGQDFPSYQKIFIETAYTDARYCTRLLDTDARGLTPLHIAFIDDNRAAFYNMVLHMKAAGCSDKNINEVLSRNSSGQSIFLLSENAKLKYKNVFYWNTLALLGVKDMKEQVSEARALAKAQEELKRLRDIHISYADKTMKLRDDGFYPSKKQTEALSRLEQSSNKTNDPALNIALAFKFFEGDGMEADSGRAIGRLLSVEHDNKSGAAAYILGLVYDNGFYDVRKDRKDAQKWFQRAKELGFTGVEEVL